MNRRNKPAFTLIEMIVVIVIIILAMTLAIPAIRSLTGSRSQEAAQNVLTTALGSARARAMAMQHVCGILFYLDSGSDRVSCAMVEETDHQQTDAAGPVYLDCVNDVDPIALPTGLRLFTMKGTVPPSYTGTGQYAEYFPGRYTGYNYPGTNTPTATQPGVVNEIGGAILFDASGRLTFRPYAYRFMYPATPTNPAHISALGAIVYGSNVALPPDWPTTAPLPFLFSSNGLVIVDRETFLNATGAAGQYTDWNNPANQPDVDKYLDTNGTPIFVNRYDATLISSQ